MEIKKQKTRTLVTKENGRSSDAVSPNFIYSCLGGCRVSYCYVMRNHHAKKKVFINENTDQILSSIQDWLDESAECKTPNQTDPNYYTIDIGCSTDIPLMWKHYNWQYVFDWFKNHPKAKATFATKYVQEKMLDYKPEGKVRIRFSLMPQSLSDKIEPNTSKISDRLKAIKKFHDAGYDVHLNFSPIVYYNGWLNDYRMLFQHVNCYVPKEIRESVKSECIFLTHNARKHEDNLENGFQHEDLLWQPEIQETKFSSYGGRNLRYERELKRELIEQFITVYNEVIPWCEIRYIF